MYSTLSCGMGLLSHHSFCLLLAKLNLLLPEQVCEVVPLKYFLMFSLKVARGQRFNHWCAEDKDKERNRQWGEGLKRHTR